MQGKDLFNQHAGSVYLYVFDEDSIMLYRKNKSKVDMQLNNVDFSFTFDESEIIPGKTYHFVAMAQGNHAGYEASLNTPGFQIVPDIEMIPGVSRIKDFIIKLDYNNDGELDFGVVDFRDTYGNSTKMIDTIWSTKPGEIQTIEIPSSNYVPSLEALPDNIVNVEVPMMRLTNSITVNLFHPYFVSTTNSDDYIFLINFPKGNAYLDFTGRIYPSQPLYYRALRKSTVPFQMKENDNTQYNISENNFYAIKAEFGVSRLQNTDKSSLQIRNSKTDKIVIKIEDFSNFLADYFEHGFSDSQEFLDREYDFEIDIALNDNDEVLWIQCGCAILGWAKRIYNYDVK